MTRGQLQRDIEYGRAGDVRLLLDAYVPESAGAILVHGGGWSGGDKSGTEKPGSANDITPWFAPLAGAGFVYFSINYRLMPENPWPAGLEDVLSAIRWVKTHAGEYKGDPNRIALFGHSAGGHLACMAAVLADESTRVQAVVGYAAVTNLEAKNGRGEEPSQKLREYFAVPISRGTDASLSLRDNSPITHIKPGLPPFILLHGDEDRSVAYATSVDFQTKLRSLRVPCELLTLKGAAHGLYTYETSDPGYSDRMLQLLKQDLASQPAKSG